MEYDLVLKKCTGITMDDDSPIIKNVNIGIKDGYIKTITDKSIEGRESIDCSNGIIMPGLVNSHTHIPMMYMRGFADDLPLKEWLEEHIWPTEAKLVKRENVKWASLLGIAEMLSMGTTLFSDMYFFEDVVAETVIESGIRGLLGEGILNFPTPAFDTPDKILEFTESLYLNYRNSEQVKISVAPHAPYTCSGDVIKRAYELSNKYSMKMHIHVAETKKEKEDFENEKGVSPVKYLDSLGVLDQNSILIHMVWVDREDMEILSKRKSSIITCPESNAKLGSGIAPIYEYMKRGIRTGIGTDSVCSNNDLDILSDARFASYIQKVKNLDPAILAARETLKMVTKNGYEILGFDKGGVIKEGYRADIVIFDALSPSSFPHFDLHSLILYSLTGREVKTTIVNGKVLYHKGEFMTIDMERVKFEISKRLKEIT